MAGNIFQSSKCIWWLLMILLTSDFSWNRAKRSSFVVLRITVSLTSGRNRYITLKIIWPSPCRAYYVLTVCHIPSQQNWMEKNYKHCISEKHAKIYHSGKRKCISHIYFSFTDLRMAKHTQLTVLHDNDSVWYTLLEKLREQNVPLIKYNKPSESLINLTG